MRVVEESGNDIKDILSHSVMIQREWSRKELISFPLWRQKERDYVSEKKRTVERVMNDTYRPKAMPGRMPHRENVTPASSGRVDGPAACRARRGPDGVRGVGDFCEPAKIHDSPGLPTGDIPSRKRTAVRTSMLEHIVFHLSPLRLLKPGKRRDRQIMSAS